MQSEDETFPIATNAEIPDNEPNSEQATESTSTETPTLGAAAPSNELEEDDLELLNENLVRSGYRRLQQRISDSESGSEDDPAPLRKRVAKEELEKLFEDDEQQEGLAEEATDDEMADFIEEIDEEVKKPKRETGTREYLKESFGGRLPSRAIQNILEIFGDGTDYLGLVDDEEEDEKTTKPTKSIKAEKAPSFDAPERIKQGDTLEPGELEAEANWIALRWSQDSSLTEKFMNIDYPTLVTAIAAVLSLFREHFTEVPWVATHRKECFQHLMGLNDLWSIWDLDEQWRLLKRQRNVLLPQITDELLLKVVQSADSMETLKVVSDFLRWQKKHDAASTMMASIKEIVGSFTLNLEDFVENLQKHQLVHSPNQPSHSPSEIRDSSHSFPSSQQLITAIVSYCSGLVGHHPYGHLSIRTFIERFAHITVTPTERGLIEIDQSQHELSGIKYLTNKPVSAFVEDQFLLILKGSSMGLITFEVVFPTMDSSVEHLGRLWGVAGEDEWSKLRRDCLVKALEDFILPPLKRDIIAKLRHSGEKWVATAGQYLLQDKMMTLPYDPNRLGHYVGKNGQFKVMAVSSSEDGLIVAVVVDEHGRVNEQSRFAKLDEQMITFIQDNEPSCILVAGRSLKIRDLFNDLERIASKMSFSSGIRSKKITVPPAVMYADDDTARIYSTLTRGQKEWPDALPLVRYCISLARRWINPLFELCSLTDTELLSVNFSQMANLVPKEMRLSLLHRAAINVVNLVGLDLNQTISVAWMRSPLRFVCGLGPKSAEALVKSIYPNETPTHLGSRSELSRFMEPMVYNNCASFLRIHDGTEILDTTRIHPENYQLARKMAADAMEMSLEEDESSAVASVMKHPERLDDLLLDEYAKELVKRGQPSKHLTLLDIKAELQQPYADLRVLTKGPSEETLFEMLTGETERTLWIGAVVRVQVSRVGDKITCRLESGLQGTLNTSERQRPGNSLEAKVIGIDPLNMTVDLVPRRPDEPLEPKYPRDPYYDTSRLPKRPSPASTSTPTAAPIQRKISHPAFRNITRSEAEALLRPALPGEAIFRPTPRGVCCSWKLNDAGHSLCQHIDLQISTDVRIGNRCYEDLDEVIARHVEPIAAYIRDVQGTPKYLPGGWAAQPAYLEEQRRLHPERIAYCMGLDHDQPGWIVLGYQPGGKVYKEMVKVSPDGLELRGVKFDSVEQMVGWFKQNYRAGTNRDDSKNPRDVASARDTRDTRGDMRGVRGDMRDARGDMRDARGDPRDYRDSRSTRDSRGMRERERDRRY